MAYKALVNKYHPDRNPNCEKSLRVIQAINASYEVLSDPDRRRQHDRWIAEQDEKYKKADQHNSDKFPSHNTSRSQPVRPAYPTPPPPQASPPKDAKSNRGGCGCLAVLAIGIFILIVSLSSQSTSSSSKSRSYVSTTPTPTYTPQHTPTPLPFDHPAVTPPKNGELVVKANYTLIAPFEIRSHAGDDYLVKLTDAITGQDAMTVFVKGGQTVNTRAPLGSFIVKYASGNTWYGYDYFFGPNTSYSKADEIFEFKRTISRSAQSRLFDLQRRLSIADADFRSFLIARGMSEKQAEYIFNGVNSDTGETGIDRLPSSYWKQFLSQIKNISLHNEIVDRLNSRNQISNQLIRLRNEEESIEGYTITLYKVRDGNLRTSEIDAEDF